MNTITLFFMILFFVMSCVKPYILQEEFSNLIWQPNLLGEKLTIEKSLLEKSFAIKKISFDKDSRFKQLVIKMDIEVNDLKAEKLINTKSMNIRALYATQATPYSGSITKKEECLVGIQINPEIQEDSKQTSYNFHLKATERFVSGGCLEDQNVYTHLIQILYCKNTQQLYEIHLFTLKSDENKLKYIASCRV